MKHIVKALVGVTLWAGATPGRSEPWWVVWTGDTYPETEGWTEWASNPPAHRWLEDGKLFIDSRLPWGKYIQYGQLRPGQMTLAPGERFLMRWTVRVDDVVGGGAHVDPGVWVCSDDQWDVIFLLGMDRIESAYEPGNSAFFTPGVFHDFVFQSYDMRTYTLLIDGTPTLEGVFFESLFYMPGMGWGDVVSDRSLAEWDHVEAGIVPEPCMGLRVIAAFCAFRPLNRSVAGRFRARLNKEKRHEAQNGSSSASPGRGPHGHGA